MTLPPSVRVLLISMGFVILLTGCRRGPGTYGESRKLMGTLVTVTVVGEEEDLPRAVNSCFEAMAALEREMSRYQPDSDVARLNRAAGEKVAVAPSTLASFLAAREISRRSHGAFDISVGPLVNLWKGAAKAGRLPDDGEVEKALGAVGWARIEILEEDSAVRLPSGLSVDLGGIAKGCIVDRGLAALKKAGVKAALVEAGGDLVSFGRKADDSPFRVGVQDPRTPDSAAVIAVLQAPGMGVTTSGHYRRYSEIQGRRYSHILDPRTGRPVENPLLSVTVVAPTCMLADGLSTAVSVLGEGRGLQLIEEVKGAECLLLKVDSKGELQKVLSSGMKNYLME